MKVGSVDISAVYVGASAVSAVYVGATQVYVKSGPQPLVVAALALPNGKVGVAYPATTVVATGGTAPYTWAAIGLPAGLTIDASTGTIAGTSTVDGTFDVTVTATDAAAASQTGLFHVTLTAMDAGETLLRTMHAWWDAGSSAGVGDLVNSGVGGSGLNLVSHGNPTYAVDHFALDGVDDYFTCPGVASTSEYVFGIVMGVDATQNAKEIAGNPVDFWMVFTSSNYLQCSTYGYSTCNSPDVVFPATPRLVAIQQASGLQNALVCDGSTVLHGNNIGISAALNPMPFNIGVEDPGRGMPRFTAWRFYGAFFHIGKLTDAELASIAAHWVKG